MPRLAILTTCTIFFLTTLCMGRLAWAELSLESKMIEQWIASQKELAVWGDQNAEKLSRYEDQEQINQNPFDLSAETLLKPLKRSGLYEDAKTIVTRHGFNTLEEWAEANLIIAKTAAAIEVEISPEMLDPKALQDMLDSANLPAEQKAMLENAMAHNLAMLENLKQISKKQKDAVRPYLERIIQLMEE